MQSRSELRADFDRFVPEREVLQSICLMAKTCPERAWFDRYTFASPPSPRKVLCLWSYASISLLLRISCSSATTTSVDTLVILRFGAILTAPRLRRTDLGPRRCLALSTARAAGKMEKRMKLVRIYNNSRIIFRIVMVLRSMLPFHLLGLQGHGLPRRHWLGSVFDKDPDKGVTHHWRSNNGNKACQEN